jgi:type IX secretion system protein PorV
MITKTFIGSADRRIGGSAIRRHAEPPTRRPSLASLLALLLISSQASAASPGTTTGELLKIPISARAVGMGEAYTAAADDSSALYWNPAGLSFMQQKEATFMHSSLIESINYEHLAFAAPGDNYSAGASMSYLGYGSIAGYDNAGNPIGDQSAYSYIFSGGASTFVHERLSVGFTGSVLREDLAGVGANTFAANLGTMYGLASHPLAGDYRLGFSVLNLGPGLKFDSERDPLPRKIQFGAEAMHIKEWPLNLTADVTIPNDNSTYIGLGSEYWFKEIIALRLGYAGSNDEGKGLRLGLGLKLREFLFDYAYGGFGDFGATHRIELSLRWGEPMRQLNREQRAILREAKRAGDKGDYIQEILTMNELLEKDPSNDRILKRMIVAHQRMLQQELKDAVAQTDTNKEAVPSPDEFALQDLVPGQQAVAQSQGGFDPKDPLGLNNLPDASNAAALMPEPQASPAVVPAPSAPPAVETKPAAAPAPAAATPETAPAAPAQDGVLLNPNDIYGN